MDRSHLSKTPGQGSPSPPPPGRLPGVRGAGEGAGCLRVSPEHEGSSGKTLLAQLAGGQAHLKADGAPRPKRMVPTASENVPGIPQGGGS